MKKILFLTSTFVFLVLAGSVSAADISTCQTLSSPGTYILTDDVSSDDICFTISADDVTFDCAGHTIIYAQTSTGYGIYIAGHTGVTIKNCNIVQGNLAFTYYSYGIFLYLGSNNNAITNNTINTNGTNTPGIYLYLNSNNNTINNNTVTTSGDSTGYGAIYLRYNSNYNTISDNTVVTSGIRFYGISSNSSSNNIITGNTITTGNSTAIESIGIYISTSSSYNTITNNTIHGRGIVLYSNSGNIITGNIIATDKMDESETYGFIISYSSNNTFASNSISVSGINAFGIYISNSSDNLFYNNYINATIPVSIDTSSNFWNTTKTLGTNIVGGPYLGGNYWANPSGTGFSETCTNTDADGICDSAYTLALYARTRKY